MPPSTASRGAGLLLAQRQAHQRPMAMRAKRRKQHYALLQVAFHPPQRKRTRWSAVAGEQLEPGQGAGGAIGDEGIAPQRRGASAPTVAASSGSSLPVIDSPVG